MTLAWKRWIPVAFLVGALGAWTFGGRALAQPQPQPQPGQPQLQPRPLPPGMQPQPGQPMPGQPGMPQRPPRPGFPPGGQPLPPGHPAVPGGGMRPPTPAPAHAEDEPHKGGHEAECPGHGPMDPPAHINWWEGILMVNNDRAGNPDAKVWERLLFRYENPKDPCDPKNLPAPFLASLLNFGLLAFVIVRFGKKPVAEALVKRRESIMQEIDNAAKLRQEAKSRLRDYKRKFETLEETLAELRAEYRQQAEGEKKRVLAEAEERRARLVRDAEFRVEQERKAAHVELLHEAAVGAVGAAEKLLEKRIAAADHERLADEYLASVVGAVRTARQAAPGGRA